MTSTAELNQYNEGGLDGRDGADDGDGEARAERGQHQRRGRIAGDDDGARRISLHKPFHHLNDMLDQSFLLPFAIGKGRIVRHIDASARRQERMDRVENGKPAYAGIENEDRSGTGRHGHCLRPPCEA